MKSSIETPFEANQVDESIVDQFTSAYQMLGMDKTMPKPVTNDEVALEHDKRMRSYFERENDRLEQAALEPLPDYVKNAGSIAFEKQAEAQKELAKEYGVVDTVEPMDVESIAVSEDVLAIIHKQSLNNTRQSGIDHVRTTVKIEEGVTVAANQVRLSTDQDSRTIEDLMKEYE